jgi:hypothetical protein
MTTRIVSDRRIAAYSEAVLLARAEIIEASRHEAVVVAPGMRAKDHAIAVTPYSGLERPHTLVVFMIV